MSTEHGLDQEFNGRDNQREAAEAYSGLPRPPDLVGDLVAGRSTWIEAIALAEWRSERSVRMRPS